ncbi:MAG: hypothetical protein PW792_08950 [Acidobacteriaceae bacterium]|nr:hypothetical protein [Acidobacteriaceae bacterium]
MMQEWTMNLVMGSEVKTGSNVVSWWNHLNVEPKPESVVAMESMSLNELLYAALATPETV